MHKKGVTIAELLVVVAIFLAMIACLAPFVHMVKARSQKIDCANNLRNLSLGLHTYALDHKGAFPAALGELYPKYVADEKTFDCPASKNVPRIENYMNLGEVSGPITVTHTDYNYVSGLTELSSPKEIIVQDWDGNHKKAGKNILRVNGSVEWIDGNH